MILWCNICNSRPADGKLTILIEDDAGHEMEEIIDACLICAHDPEKVEFV